MTSAVLAGRNEVHHAHPAHRPCGGAKLLPRPPRPNPERHRPPGPNPNPVPTPSAALVPYYFAPPPPEPPAALRRVTIRLSEMTRLEARQAQARLAGELGRVRALLARIDAYQDAGHRRREAPDPGPPRHASPYPTPPALRAAMLKRCGQILTRLRRQKVCHWFNVPVDVEGLKLYDYHAIIRRPMDLGTVKANLAAGSYPSHEEFAADVRLTFHNALRYNPPGHQVHTVAGNLLANFEALFVEAVAWFEQEFLRLGPPPPPPLALLPPPPPSPPAPQPQPQPVHVPLQVLPPQRVGGGRRPKPKARDPHKREMDAEEKRKLEMEIEKLPIDKQQGLVQILQKRCNDPALFEDEFELDLDEMDVETLWELDRFVLKCKKVSGKGRRNSVAVNVEIEVMNGEMFDVKVAPDEDGMVEIDANPPAVVVETGDSEIDIQEQAVEADMVNEEYVDIGDEMPTVNYQSVEIEKDNQMASSSSDSGSASSSNGSDSRSSADSDSDGDDACSPDEASCCYLL